MHWKEKCLCNHLCSIFFYVTNFPAMHISEHIWCIGKSFLWWWWWCGGGWLATFWSGTFLMHCIGKSFFLRWWWWSMVGVGPPILVRDIFFHFVICPLGQSLANLCQSHNWLGIYSQRWFVSKTHRSQNGYSLLGTSSLLFRFFGIKCL